MKRITGMVSDERKEIFRTYQRENGITTQDEAIEGLIDIYAAACKRAVNAKEAANHIDELVEA